MAVEAGANCPSERQSDIECDEDERYAHPETCTPSTKAGSLRAGVNQLLMKRALRRLAQLADVVAITTQRGEVVDRTRRDETNERIAARNRSMCEICDLGVSFATPFAYRDAGEPDYRFLGPVKNDLKVGTIAIEDHLPRGYPIYPSLGTLMGMAAASGVRGESRKCSAQSARVGDLCQDVTNGKELPIPLLDFHDSEPTRKFEWRYLNLVRASTEVTLRRVASPSDVENNLAQMAERWPAQKENRSHRPMLRPMIILSVDDGFSDRHLSVLDQPGQVTGDFLEAARGISVIEPLEDARWLGVALDLAVGVVYLLAWTMILHWIAGLRRSGFATLASCVMIVSPLTLSFFLGSFALLFSAHRLSDASPVWLSPVFVLIGLTLHAYLSVAEKAIEETASETRLFPRRPVSDVWATQSWEALRLLVIIGTVLAVLLESH